MRHGELKVWIEEWNGAPVVCAEGEIDLASVDALRKAASQVVREGPSKVIFDLRGVNYIDSSGLGVLVAARRRLAAGRGVVVVVTAQAAVLQALNLTGLDRILEVRTEPYPASTHPAT